MFPRTPGRLPAAHGSVAIVGGGDAIGQALEQGLIDELRLHLAPMLLGGGAPTNAHRPRHR